MKRILPFLLSMSLSAIAHEEPVDLCTEGFLQSPININHVEPVKMPDLKFKYQEARFKFFDRLPTNIFALPQDDLYLIVEDIPYKLVNIHVHTPGEHQLANKDFPLEIHFVHKSFEGYEYAVAQWVTVGRSNPALQIMLDNFALGLKKPRGTQLIFGLDPSGLLAPFSNYYRYQGSETYPPCSENVTWFVLKNTLEVGKDQIMGLRQLLGENNRPLQPLNGREISSSAKI